MKLQGSFILLFSNYKAQVKSSLLAVFQIQNPSSNCLMGTQSILVKLHQHNLQRRPSFIPCMLVSFSKIYILYFNVLLLCRLWLQSRTSNHNMTHHKWGEKTLGIIPKVFVYKAFRNTYLCHQTLCFYFYFTSKINEDKSGSGGKVTPRTSSFMKSLEILLKVHKKNSNAVWCKGFFISFRRLWRILVIISSHRFHSRSMWLQPI